MKECRHQRNVVTEAVCRSFPYSLYMAVSTVHGKGGDGVVSVVFSAVNVNLHTSLFLDHAAPPIRLLLLCVCVRVCVCVCVRACVCVCVLADRG